jgi:hypothetical protein
MKGETMRPKRTAPGPVTGLVWKYFVSLSLVFLTALPDAHAYIDPGSGALLWQALLAAFVGALFYVRSIGRLVMNWIRDLMQRAVGKHE